MINTLWKICSTCKSNGDCKNPSWDGKNNCKDYEPNTVIETIPENLQPNTIQFDRCERIIFRDKTLYTRIIRKRLE